MTSNRKKGRVLDRREFPRLDAAFTVRFGVCGHEGREVPGFTSNISLSGLSFFSPETKAEEGDHIAVEIVVPGYAEPLYFLGEVMRVEREASGCVVACRFDWLGKSDSYKEKLQALLDAHN